MSRPRPGLLVLLNRFWQSIELSLEGCWEWLRARNPRSGYGVMRWDGLTRTAHTLSWEFHFGQIPSGLNVLHQCDNRKCVRPDHLFLGTLADNNHDMFVKGRYKTGPKVTYNGESLHLAEWSRRLGIGVHTLGWRLRRGWPIEKAFIKPTRKQ